MTVIVFLALLLPLVISQDCLQSAESGNCTFYSSCVENRLPCGDLGYALNYGKRYCEAFGEFYHTFNDKGKRWIRGVRSCLMKAIHTSDILNKKNCEDLKTFAFDSHPKCYVDQGFCSNILLDVTNLRALFQLFTKYPYGITSNKALSLDQIMKTAIRCSRNGNNTIVNTIKGFSTQDDQKFNDFLMDLKEFFSSGCYRDIDVLFLMDSSGSVGASNYDIMKNFVADVLISFNLTQGSRIGIITFNSITITIVPLSIVSDVNDLAAMVRGISFSGGATYTDLVLNAALAALADKKNTRIGILLTDGQSNRPNMTLTAAAALHAAGVEMYTFGIGNTNPAELEAIASEPHADYSFYISTFDRSRFNELLLLLARQTCTTPEQGLQGVDSSYTIGESESAYIVYPFHVNGTTIELNVSNGCIEAYGSFLVRNPARTTSDFSFTEAHSILYFVSPKTFEQSTGMQLGATNQTTNASYNVHLTIVGKSSSNIFMIRTAPGKPVPPKPRMCTVPEFPGCTLLGETPQQIFANHTIAFACGHSSNVTLQCRENGTWESEVKQDNREFPGCTLLGDAPRQVFTNQVLAFACGNSASSDNMTACGATLVRCKEDGIWEELDYRVMCIKAQSSASAVSAAGISVGVVGSLIFIVLAFVIGFVLEKCVHFHTKSKQTTVVYSKGSETNILEKNAEVQSNNYEMDNSLYQEPTGDGVSVNCMLEDGKAYPC